MLGRLAREVDVVHRSDHSSERVEDDVEEDHGQRDSLAYHAEQDEHVGDHHRREQLEEVLHPEVDDPKAPELVDGEVLSRLCDQAHRIEGRDGERRHEEQPRHVGGVLAAQSGAQDAPQHEHPDEEPNGEQHLPDPRQIQVLEALEAEPVRRSVPEQPVYAEEGADQRAEYHHGQRAEQHEGELALSPRLAPSDHRREEDAGGHEGGRHPEQSQLHVPGAHQVEREGLGEVDAKEAGQLGPVVL